MRRRSSGARRPCSVARLLAHAVVFLLAAMSCNSTAPGPPSTRRRSGESVHSISFHAPTRHAGACRGDLCRLVPLRGGGGGGGGGSEGESEEDVDDEEVRAALAGWNEEEEEEIQRVLASRDPRPPPPKTPPKDMHLPMPTEDPVGPESACVPPSASSSSSGVVFQDNVREAVEQARERGACLLVWMPGEDEATRRMMTEVWSDGAVTIAATHECVPVRVLPDTEESAWLADAHGKPKELPATLVLGPTGKLIGKRSGPSTASQILRTLDMALATVGLGEETAGELRKRQHALGTAAKNGGLGRGVLEDARRAVQGGGQGGTAGGKEVVAEEEDGGIYWEGEVKRGAGAISDLFDKIYKSEVSRREAEREAEQRTARAPKKPPPVSFDGEVCRIPPGLDGDAIQQVVALAAPGSEILFCGAGGGEGSSGGIGGGDGGGGGGRTGNHSWKWDLDVCEADTLGAVYDEATDEYIDEGEAWEKALQMERTPLAAKAMSDVLSDQVAEVNEHAVTRELNFRGEGGAKLMGRWWLKLGTSGNITSMACNHASNAIEPCPHTPPMSLRIPDAAYTPWKEGSKGVPLSGIFETPDDLVPQHKHVHTFVSFNISMMSNDEGMKLEKGRWVGEHAGGAWDGNIFKYANGAGFVQLDGDDDCADDGGIGGHAGEEMPRLPRIGSEPTPGEKAVGERNPHVYRHCTWCVPRARNLFNVMSGPWSFTDCDLKGGRIVVLRASHRCSDVSLKRCFLGGLSPFNAEEAALEQKLIAGLYIKGVSKDGQPSLEIWDGFDRDQRAHYGLSGMATGSRITADECSIRDCGYAQGGAAQFMHGAKGVLSRCKMEHCYRGVGVDDQVHVTVSHSSLAGNRRGSFFAMAYASGATLILENNVVKGRLWEAFKRPGTLSQMGNQFMQGDDDENKQGDSERARVDEGPDESRAV